MLRLPQAPDRLAGTLVSWHRRRIGRRETGNRRREHIAAVAETCGGGAWKGQRSAFVDRRGSTFGVRGDARNRVKLRRGGRAPVITAAVPALSLATLEVGVIGFGRRP